MDVKPLSSYKVPAYPEKHIVLRNPNILKSLPQRWKGNAKIGIALSSLVMMMLSGCTENSDEPGRPAAITGTGETAAVKQTNTKLQISYEIAPVFRHGDGRGSFGCVSVAPPAFLSEAEAFEVISEEAKREGIIFSEGGLTLDKVEIPVTSLNYNPDGEKNAAQGSKRGELELDGYDAGKKIAYEFISTEDIAAWKDENQGVRSSVDSYDAVGTAERLKDGLKDRNDGNTVAVFYDPMGFDEENSKKYMAKFREISENEKLTDQERQEKWTQLNRQQEDELKAARKSLLREQVKDFLDWMKAQGII